MTIVGQNAHLSDVAGFLSFLFLILCFYHWTSYLLGYVYDVFACLWTCVCIHVNLHRFHCAFVEVRGTSSGFIQGFFVVFISHCIDQASWQATFPAFSCLACHCRSTRLQTCTSAPSLYMVPGIWIQVSMLADKCFTHWPISRLCRSCLPSSIQYSKKKCANLCLLFK